MELYITPTKDKVRQQLRKLVLYLIGPFSKVGNGIHLINSHYSWPTEDLGEEKRQLIFERFIEIISTYGEIIDLNEAILKIKQKKQDKPYFVLTFDDGFKDMYKVVFPVLTKHKLKGVFFINANYISSDKTYRKSFNDRTKTFYQSPMNWSMIKEMHSMGHIIGSHGLNHYRLTDLSEHDLLIEIQENKRILEKNLNYKCEHYAWTYGRENDVNSKIVDTIKKFHPYVYSSFDHRNYYSYNNQVLNRRHIEPFWPKSHIKFFLNEKK